MHSILEQPSGSAIKMSLSLVKSPRKVLKLAYAFGQEALSRYLSRFSRHDGFTRPQLFACLVLREHQKKSYRGIEALLIDSPAWLADLDPSRAPDHNTLSRVQRIRQAARGRVDGLADVYRGVVERVAF